MSSTLVESAEKFDKLQSRVVNVRTERIYAYVENVADDENRRGDYYAQNRYAVYRKQADNNLADFVYHHSDYRRRKSETEQTAVRQNIA